MHWTSLFEGCSVMSQIKLDKPECQEKPEVHITIDTNNITEQDRAVLAFVLSGETDPYAASLAVPAAATVAVQTVEPEKPKRSRRTNLEIAFDDARAAFDGSNKGDGSEYKALAEAYDALKAKDPNNERLKDFGLPEVPETGDEEQLTDALTAESDTADEAVSIETVVELATQLNASNKARLREILAEFDAPRVGALDESQYPAFVQALRSALQPVQV